MLDTRKSGLVQSSPPSMSRNELFEQRSGGEVKPAVRARNHSHVDPHAIIDTVAHAANNEFGAPTAPRVVGDPKVDEGITAAADRIVNGAFAADTDWTKGTGWTIAAGVATCSGAQVGDSDLTQVGATLLEALVQNQAYEVTFTVSGYVAGNVTPVVGDNEGTDRAADGTFTEIVIAGAGADIDIRGDLNFDGNVDAVSVRRAAGSVKLGGTLRLSCGAVGDGTETYQWQVDAGDIVGATDAILTIPNIDQTDAGAYTCDVTNATGTTSSAAVAITVV